MRQTFVWADEHEVLSPGASMPGPDVLAEWARMARTSLTPADENVPNVMVFTVTKPGTQVKLPAGLAAKQRPHH
jgi:hypothetical protein